MRAAAAMPIRPWVLLASSREVYGEPGQLPVREDTPMRPVNVYGRSKAAAERVALAWRRSGVDTAVVRMANVDDYALPPDVNQAYKKADRTAKKETSKFIQAGKWDGYTPPPMPKGK